MASETKMPRAVFSLTICLSSLFGAILVYFFLPETSQVTLEQMDERFYAHSPRLLRWTLSGEVPSNATADAEVEGSGRGSSEDRIPQISHEQLFVYMEDGAHAASRGASSILPDEQEETQTGRTA
eukprot:CAMPEP_0177591078 /NCGR_PEP_ID=MMETSP0419_2-20121207/7784_1 /TAXON_ID=582737 /ORGANISM="Tetraselmis sp., Strain GSL018" /LENGTH=124 /DNA_ID=CAMNT_0019081753 /DNA_START=1431 /DNA_END=1805 /DNA_ORIENTATION=+